MDSSLVDSPREDSHRVEAVDTPEVAVVDTLREDRRPRSAPVANTNPSVSEASRPRDRT